LSTPRSYWVAALVAALALAPALVTAQQRANSREILRRASDTLKHAKRLSFHAELSFDEEPRPGLLVQLGGAVDIDLRRPNGLRVDYRDDGSAKTLWYDGSKLTLLDWANGVFATWDAPDTVDETMNRIEEKLGLSLPLADLIAPDPAGALLEGALRGTYLGIHDVEGIPCHHLAFLQDNVDWEIWIEDGKVPVPRKILIRYKERRGWPQYTALLMDWKIDPKLADDTFAAKVPKDAVEVEFIEARRAQP
jgi:hypothetical protein